MAPSKAVCSDLCRPNQPRSSPKVPNSALIRVAQIVTAIHRDLESCVHRATNKFTSQTPKLGQSDLFTGQYPPKIVGVIGLFGSAELHSPRTACYFSGLRKYKEYLCSSQCIRCRSSGGALPKSRVNETVHVQRENLSPPLSNCFRATDSKWDILLIS